MAEDKLAKIEVIKFKKANSTAYGLALQGMKNFGDITPRDTAYVAGGCAISTGVLLVGIFALSWGSLAQCLVSAAGGVLSAISLLILLAVGLPNLSFCWGNKRKAILADPLSRFEWRLAKAVEIFNERAWAFNYLLSGHELGLAQEDEIELARIHSLLSQSREVLARGKETREWLQNNNRIGNLSIEPKLSPLLAELAEAECDLQEHLAELKSDASPARRLLASEAELIELTSEEVRALLPEKT